MGYSYIQTPPTGRRYLSGHTQTQNVHLLRKCNNKETPQNLHALVTTNEPNNAKVHPALAILRETVSLPCACFSQNDRWLGVSSSCLAAASILPEVIQAEDRRPNTCAFHS